MTAKEFQNGLIDPIENKFQRQEVRNEWTAFTGQIYQYSPRVDIAVGPFSIAPGPNRINDYNRLLRTRGNNRFLRSAFAMHIENLDQTLYEEIIHPDYAEAVNRNQNARCFIAFEIENKNSKKHIMGSIVNAASLGRVGIGIAFTESTLRTFCRILNYLSFLRRVGKNTYDTTNFFVLTIDQINELLE